MTFEFISLSDESILINKFNFKKVKKLSSLLHHFVSIDGSDRKIVQNKMVAFCKCKL